jgi:hypothetical protein
MLERIINSTLADKIMLLLPVLETRIDPTMIQNLGDSFAVRNDIPLDSLVDYRQHTRFLAPFLSANELANWTAAWRSAPHFWLCHDTPLVIPHDPIPHRTRGPSKDTPRLSASHDRPSKYLIFHHAWDFLDRRDRTNVVNTYPIMKDYAKLRCSATMRNLTPVLKRRPPPTELTPLCHQRAWIISCALIRFNFVYADLIRWLGGEYTNDHRDWTSVFQFVDHVRGIPIPAGNPPIDFERAVHIATSGAPIAGHFQCSFDDVARREQYDNHPPLKEVQDEVRKKFEKEESLSYQIALPRFLWAFIYGLFITPISFVLRRPGEEGRICPDPSNIIHPDDTGNANAHIPDTGAKGAEDENPAVYYGNALTRLLIWIWNLRIARPSADILGHVDDISAAYHRILYHPMMGITFAQVFQEFLMIPCGLIFGSKSSPSWYMLPAELRSHLASVADFGDLETQLAREIQLPPPLTPKEQARLARADADSLNQGNLHLQAPFCHPSFVDDTATAAWTEFIRKAVNQSALGAYVMFGFPGTDRRPPPLNPSKWENLVAAIFKYLGFLIDTRNMIVIWPLEKRQQLRQWLDETWLNPDVTTVTPKEAGQLLGLIRHGAPICPLGVYLSMQLQFELNDFVSRAGPSSTSSKRWWTRFRFRITSTIRADCRLLRNTLEGEDNFYHPIWSRDIGLLIPREVNTIPISDASYEGLGGFCRTFRYMWRLSVHDLRSCGWKICGDEESKNQLHETPSFSPKPGPDEAHINVLEFVAIIINMWMLLKLIDKGERPPGVKTHIIARFLADNTSALSWLRHAGRTKRPQTRNLARLLTSLLLHRNFPLQISSQHIPGSENLEADCLSRFSKHPSWESLMNDASLDYRHLRAYQVPQKLLTTIWSIASNTQIADMSAQVMIALWRLELKPLPTGWEVSDSMTSLLAHGMRKLR